jgi:alpha-2-macroglobulin
MKLTPDVKARIENHLNAVRANLAGQEEAVQNEVLDGLRDHINETLSRQGGPVTLETVQSVLAEMDDPASYVEEPARPGGAHAASGRSQSNKWLCVALAFLAVNSVGVWKLVQIERKTVASAAGGAGYSSVEVPHVPSGDKAGIHYPESSRQNPPRNGGAPAETTGGKATLRSIAFLENRNPVVQKPDEELSWLFNEDVVEASEVGKPLARGPLMITPEMAGAFQWKTPAQLVFTPAKPWAQGQSYTAELIGEFKTFDGNTYEGTRFWRFGTAACGLEKFEQVIGEDSFDFTLDLSMPVTSDSLASKLKLHYLTADGEKLDLEHEIELNEEGRGARIKTPIVPAVSFLCEIEPGLQPKHWSDGTRERIERRLLNSRLLNLSGAMFGTSETDGRHRINLLFSAAVVGENLMKFVEVSPALPVSLVGSPQKPVQLALVGDFVPGTTYEIKLKRGLPSIDGRVLPYTTTRSLVLANVAGTTQPGATPKPVFDSVVFKPDQGIIDSGKQEIRWIFPSPMVGREEVGRTLENPPMRLSPDTQGSFFWETAEKLTFRPNTEWALNQYHEARLVGALSNLAGASYSGVRFWTFTTPAMAIKEVRQIDSSAGFRFGVEFTTEPHPDSLTKNLKVFCYDAAGAKVNLPFTVANNYSGSINKMVIVPSLPSAQIRFEMEPGFRPAKWEQGIREGMEMAAVISTVLNVESVTASEPGERKPAIRIKFSEGVDVKTAVPFVTVEPEVKFTLERESSYNRQHSLRLIGAFEAHREYRVGIKAGLVSERGCLLIKDRTVPVTISRAAATLAFGGAGGYLSPAGTMLVPVKSQNLSKCKVSVAPVMASNLVFFAKRSANDASFSLPVPADDDDDTNSSGSGYEYEEEYGYRYGRSIDDLIGNITHKEFKLAEKPNQENTSYVKLGDYTKSKGAYLVQLSGLDAKNEDNYRRQLSDSRLVVVTDLGISAKLADSHVLVWVCSLKDAKPAGGVEVTAYSGNNQFIAKALTNADGVAAIPCNSADKNTSPFLVTAQLAEDLSYLTLDGAGLCGDDEDGTPARNYLASGCEAFVFTDRGIFRPGETVHSRAIIRQADFTAPQPFPVVFQILKPDGRLFKEMTAMPNAFGAVEIETAMPDFLPTGRYTLRVRVPKAKQDLGATSFLLEDFVPPQIRVAVKADPERIAAKETMNALIHAEHLFGAPAAGLKATVKCIYSPVAFAPKQWADYQFGRDTSNYYGMSEAPAFTMNPQDIDGLVLDAEGKVTAGIATAVPANAPGPVRAQIQASVFEQSGRSVTATTSAMIDPYPFYIGMKRFESGWLKSGKLHKVAVVAVRPDGEPFKPANPLAVRMSRVEWNYSYKATPGGGYAYQSHREVTLMREDPLDLSSGSGEYAFTPDGYGQIELAIVDAESGTSTSFSFYTSDYEQSWTTTDRERPDSLTLKLDKAEYRTGDVAKLTIQAPFSGTALLTVESDKVLFSRVILLEKNTAEVDVEVKDEYAPNVHCTVSVIRPAVAEAVWKGHRAFGSLPLKVSPAKHRIQVAIEAPQTIQPQSRLLTKVTLKDDAGQPVDGEVTLVAVDEAICMLTSFKSPSPLAWLYQLRSLGVGSHDIYAELMEVFDESVLTKESHASGDGGEGEESAAERLTKRLNPIKANRFKPVALWVSQVEVTGGVAEIGMDVPEFTGELRLMAVACNSRLLGSAQGMVKVKRPLIVQPSLPRFLAPGDECRMDVTVYNEIGKDITAKLRITCGGPISTTANEQDVIIAKGGSASVSIPMVAGKLPGKALCTVSCEAETVRYSDTIEIAVRPPISAEVAADSGSLAPGKSIVINPQANWLPETTVRRIRVSKQPDLELGRGLQFLLRYPHGCIEQTTSAAFPLLYLPDLANQTFDKSMTRDSVKHYVNSGVWRILSMQQAGGGFSYWPGYQDLHPWGSSYATHFLLEAKKAGYEVPQSSLDRAVKSLRASVEAVPGASERNEYFYDNLAYACYVLAIAGEPSNAWLERMLEMKSGLSYYARLMNASSLLVGGDPKRAVALLKELGLPGPGSRDFGGCFNSPNRNAALLLSAWLDIEPKQDDVFKLVQILGKSRINGYWGTTQDSAMALMALGKYAQRVKGVVREYKGTIILPGGGTEAFDQNADRTWDIARGEKGAVTLANDGPGLLYYSFESEGVPVDTAEYYKKLESRNRGMKVSREWFDEKGNPLDPATVKQNDLVVARITLEPNGNAYDNIVIEDLLPAGLEVENPNLDTAQTLPWLTTKFDWCARRDIRDDRVLLFTKPVHGKSEFCYLARAVTPGRFTVPPVSAECMYDPEIRSVTSQTEMTISK